ncbi:carboxypeptidase-like regulatory domain-containing protein [Myroides sp. DW712]|uniref:carboxypeptidase-like regulatory domain-containing protein n=1 Tax=Myroides sp. DW712 TaxID=3389800 RepID=UPI00397822A7
MIIRYLCFVLFLFLSLGIHAQEKSKNGRYTLFVQLSNPEAESIPYATVEIASLNLIVTTDQEGKVQIKLPEGSFTLAISALGYQPQEHQVVLQQDRTLSYAMTRQSVELEEFVIMAQYNKKKPTIATITQTALTYIQPTSLVDALVLLPGSVYQQPSLNQFSGVNFRQSGRDSNSSLGVSIVSNGVAMNSDGTRNQLYGITANSNPSYGKEGNLVFNAGMDMRMISTDHIESIEITRGISSAKQGNLSSGQINLNAKQGISPLELRAKVDPTVQLAYIGKGFALPERLGVLHLGMDLLSAKPDVRESLTKFTRFTAQANHVVDFALFDYDVSMNTKVNYTQTLDNYKSDQSTEYNDEVYKVQYNKLDFTWKLSSFLDKSWIDKLELLAHVDYTKDRLDRSLQVYSDGGVNMSNATEPGVHEAYFLPSKYYTSYQLDNQPVNIFLQLNGGKYFNLAEGINQNILYGVEYNSAKNYGKGAVINPALPPFPSNNAFIRPRANKAIPALIHTAYYLESKWDMAVDALRSTTDFTMGVRGVQLHNLPESYALNNKLLVEPRLQLNWTTHYDEEAIWTTNLRIGYGQQNKLPTLDYLYPDPIYSDLEVLNWYDTKPENRLLLTHTFIHEVENNQLKTSKTDKFEVGADVYWKGFSFSLTAFSERSARGFAYHYEYIPVVYTKLTTPLHPIEGKPTAEDFETKEQHRFVSLPRVRNSSTIEKKGIEYRLVFPTIEAIQTSLEVNGAYYKTEYSSNEPKMFYPKTISNNETYPFVGIYPVAPSTTLSRFNTNLWINTRIPKLKLVFTTFVQALWYTTSQRGSSESFVPSAYLDENNTIHPVDFKSIIADRPDLLPLDLRSEKANFSVDKTKPDFTINLKGTKEFKNWGSISFFVNNIININSKYKNNYNVNQRKWSSPYFGIEVTLKR